MDMFVVWLLPWLCNECGTRQLQQRH